MQKNNNGFHSEGLSMSGLSLFTSVAEQKLRTGEGSVSLHVPAGNQIFPERKSQQANRLTMITCMYLEFYIFQSKFAFIFLINIPNYFEMRVM